MAVHAAGTGPGTLPDIDRPTPGSVQSEGGWSGPEPHVTDGTVTSIARVTAPPPRPVVVAIPVREDDSTGVLADDAWAEAGRKVMRVHLRRILARLPGVVDDEDVDDVHAMRVAARRMRAAWRVFGDGFEDGAKRRNRRELRDVGARLGAVRDLDVLIEILGTPGHHRGRQRVGLEPLRARWRADREAKRADLVITLQSAEFVRFIRDHERLVGTPGYAALAVKPHDPALVRDRMPAKIWRAYGSVRAFDAAIGTADQATLHELRIAAKWLRYTLEFIREPLEPEATSLIRSVTALQDDLGDIHDQHAAAWRARLFLASVELTARQATSISKLIEHLDRNVDQVGHSLGSTWQRIIAPSYRRRLGRAIARL